jgi:BirA family biotin operon repressor/biotin-[acetyl-CoA-carboxylase] ligase
VTFSAPPADVQSALDAAGDTLGPFAILRYAESIGSTNDAALALAAAGEPEGSSVLADQQTAGRGRRGRSWSSPPGAGLYLSVVLRGEDLARAPGLVTLGAGSAASAAIEQGTGLPVRLKWPNDLVVDAEWRKLGGILCEAQGRDALVIGIGINLTDAAHPPDVRARATSVESELGRSIDRGSIIVGCLAGLRALAAALRSGNGAAIVTAWRERAADGWREAPVHWVEGERTINAVAKDIDTDGGLIVERDGRLERVVAGEVLWNRRP